MLPLLFKRKVKFADNQPSLPSSIRASKNTPQNTTLTIQLLELLYSYNCDCMLGTYV